MTVRDLITMLQQQDQNAEVKILDGNCVSDVGIEKVNDRSEYSYLDTGTILLESK